MEKFAYRSDLAGLRGRPVCVIRSNLETMIRIAESQDVFDYCHDSIPNNGVGVNGTSALPGFHAMGVSL